MFESIDRFECKIVTLREARVSWLNCIFFLKNDACVKSLRFFKTILKNISSLCGANDTLVLDFWWRLSGFQSQNGQPYSRTWDQVFLSEQIYIFLTLFTVQAIRNCIVRKHYVSINKHPKDSAVCIMILVMFKSTNFVDTHETHVMKY